MKGVLAPDYATHYHLADKAPFLNLSDLEEPELSRVIAELAERKRASGLKRIFGRRYMSLRQLTEARLYEKFIAAGGKPSRRAPHYFCLGSCPWFLNLAPDMREVVVPLSALPDDVTSFAYPDSFVSMHAGSELGLDLNAELRPYHQRVFRLDELPDVIREYGVPGGEVDDDYEGYHRRPFEKFIELQVWSDEPLRPFLR